MERGERGPIRDLTGTRFGKLTVLAYDACEKKWKCRCDCGNSADVRATLLVSGHTASCGCAKRELDVSRDFKKILTYTGDTCIEFARDIGKKRADTSPDTGVRGVCCGTAAIGRRSHFGKKGTTWGGLPAWKTR